MIPINVDSNVTHRDLHELLDEDEVLVHSNFYTFQGEGPFAGQPAWFVRLAGCNIGLKQDCPWCDTAFALRDGRPWVINNFVERIAEHYRRAKLVVVTGGEPLLQWHRIARIIPQVTEYFPELRWQFETNGLLLRDSMLDFIKYNPVFIVASPKVPHSWDRYRKLPEMFLQNNPALSEKLCLKYVVSADRKSPYHDIPADAHTAALAGFRVYVSGMTEYIRTPVKGEVVSVWDETLIDRHSTAANYVHAARLALAHGFNVSYQSHLFGAVQ